jgi:hypothetical protein
VGSKVGCMKAWSCIDTLRNAQDDSLQPLCGLLISFVLRIANSSVNFVILKARQAILTNSRNMI